MLIQRIRTFRKTLFCECDHQMIAQLGNVFTEGSFRKVWQGDRAQCLREHFGKDGVIDLEFCQRCRYKLNDAFPHVEQFS